MAGRLRIRSQSASYCEIYLKGAERAGLIRAPRTPQPTSWSAGRAAEFEASARRDSRSECWRATASFGGGSSSDLDDTVDEMKAQDVERGHTTKRLSKRGDNDEEKPGELERYSRTNRPGGVLHSAF